MMRWMPFVIIAAIIAAISATAVAQSTSDVRVKATARFKQGQEFFKANDYDHALAEYEAAYRLSHEPLLIFNIALCHDRARRPEQALAAFERYLALAPSGEAADEAREDVVRLTAIVDRIHARQAAEDAQRAEKERQAEAARAAEQAARAAEDAARAAAQAAREAAQADRDRRLARRKAMEAEVVSLAQRSRFERWGGIGAAALGAISLAVAASYGLDARAAAQDITRNRGPWTDALLARDAEGRAAQSRMVVFTSAGGAALIVGGILYWLGHRHDTAVSQLRLELEVQPAGGSIAMSGAMTGRF